MKNIFLRRYSPAHFAFSCNKSCFVTSTLENINLKVDRFKSTHLSASQPRNDSSFDDTLIEDEHSHLSLSRWEKQKSVNRTKWKFLEHKGPLFAPPYERLPCNVKFLYNGEELELSPQAEEVATFYAKVLHLEYVNKITFNLNFLTDWRSTMTEEERAIITDINKCNFRNIQNYFKQLTEKNKNQRKEQKTDLKERNERLLKEYGYCIIDGHKERIFNFRIEPPGLFRGRGEHPKMGKLKKRIKADDVIINCSADSKIPIPPQGHQWKEVRHDPTVSWLAAWTENIQNRVKYIMLNPSSKLRSSMDTHKYELARRLHNYIDKIRTQYRKDWESNEMFVKQRSVALYFIDKLALRAGYEKDEDELETAGCCTLRVEHIKLYERKDGKQYIVIFDFLAKDAIRYYNEVSVEKEVFDNLKSFVKNKQPPDYLFDLLSTYLLNKYLNELMEGLTAKVFRTYNASWTFQQELNKLTNSNDNVSEKILSYNRANRAVALLCNHQCTIPKNHENQIEKISLKIKHKQELIKDLETDLSKIAYNSDRLDEKKRKNYERKNKRLQKLKEELIKLQVQKTNKDENKMFALSTSKINYLDPRITISWCKKYNVPLEKIYSKTQQDKFKWAIESTQSDYQF